MRRCILQRMRDEEHPPPLAVATGAIIVLVVVGFAIFGPIPY